MPPCARLLVVSVAGLSLTAGLSCEDEDSAAAFARAYCDLLKPCCAMASLRADGKQCQVVFGAFGGPATYNKQEGDACLAETRAAAARADFCKNLETKTPACDRVFEQPAGTKQLGETCSQTADCARSTEGEVDCQSGVGPGNTLILKCQVVIPGKEGDKPCVGTKESDYVSSNPGLDDVPGRGYLCDAAAGLRCDGMTDTCVRLKATGEACASSSSECVRSAYCDRDAGKCLERKGLGAACTSGGFANDQCVVGAWCNTGGACAAKVSDGAACTDMDQCQSQSCVSNRCEPSSLGNIALAFVCGIN